MVEANFTAAISIGAFWGGTGSNMPAPDPGFFDIGQKKKKKKKQKTKKKKKKKQKNKKQKKHTKVTGVLGPSLGHPACVQPVIVNP